MFIRLLGLAKFSFGLVLLAFFSMQTASAQLPSIDDFFPDPEYSDVDLSPDGTRVAVVKEIDNADNQVFIVNLDDPSQVNRLDINADVSYAQWASNDRLLLSIRQKRESTRGDFSFSRMVAIDPDGENFVGLFSNADSRIQQNFNLSVVRSRLPDDPNHIMMPAYQGNLVLFKVNIYDGKATEVERGEKGTVAFGVNRKGQAVLRYDRNRYGTYTTILVRAPGEKKWSKVVRVRNEDLKDVNIIAETDDPAVFYVSARPEGYDRATIFKYNLKTQTYSEPISSHDEVDQFRVITDTKDKFFGTVYFDDRLEYDFVDKTQNKHIKAVNGFFDNESNVTIYQVSDDGKRWLLKVESPQDPGSVYHYNLDTYRVEALVSSMTTLKPQQLGKIDAIRYKARDGQNIRGYLTHPAGNSSKTAPLIVMPHGGPELRDYYGYDRMSQFLASRGYRVFQPNFRGSTGYGTAYTEAGHGEWGGLMQEDITDGVRHLIDTGQAQAGNICIAGASFGGYSALIGAVQNGDLYKCSVSIAGVYDLNDMVFQDRVKFRGDSESFEYIEKTIGKYKKDTEKLEAWSPTDQVNKINIPLLVMHGEDDQRIAIKQARKMRDALKSAGKDYRFVEYPNVSHSLTGLTDAAEKSDDESDDDYYYAYKLMLAEMEAFFGEHLTR